MEKPKETTIVYWGKIRQGTQDHQIGNFPYEHMRPPVLHAVFHVLLHLLLNSWGNTPISLYTPLKGPKVSISCSIAMILVLRLLHYTRVILSSKTEWFKNARLNEQTRRFAHLLQKRIQHLPPAFGILLFGCGELSCYAGY